MYYNQVTQPDGTVCIGVNLEEQRPEPFDIEQASVEVDREVEVHEFFTKYMSHVHECFFLVTLFLFIYVQNAVNLINIIFSFICMIGVYSGAKYLVVIHTMCMICLVMVCVVINAFEYLFYYFPYMIINVCSLSTLVEVENTIN